MALPSRPNARVGLPSNPAPRSRSLSRRDPRDDLPRPESTASEFIPWRPAPSPPGTPLRHQRSLNDARGNHSRARSVDSRRHNRPSSPPPPLPTVPVPVRSAGWRPERSADESAPPYAASRKRADGTVTSWGSASSGSSVSQDSLRSYGSYASSRTSVDTNVADTAKGDGQFRLPEEPAVSPSSDSAEVQNGDGLRAALWNRVAAAAGSLKVNVTKALGATLSAETGEVTPLGQESSLTRAMKAYHVEKARDANELPDWLFEGRDRDVISRLRGASQGITEQNSEVATGRQASPVPGIPRDAPAARDAPDTSPPVSWRPVHSRAPSGSSAQSVHATIPSRDAMHRLKELRIAKRNAKVRFADDDGQSPDEPVRAIRRPPTPGAGDSPRTSPTDAAPAAPDPVTPRRRPTVHHTVTPQRAGSPRVGLPTSVRPQRAV